MITAEALKRVNEGLKTVPIKGKDYVQVTERIKAFRDLCPEGSIFTEVIHFGEGMILMKATITDEDGKVLATGHAMEKEESSYINKTSYVENCETSAWGRALAALNIGIDASICSADELVNAVTNQGDMNIPSSAKKATKANIKTFQGMCDHLGLDQLETLKKTGWKSGDMTEEQFARALVIFKEIENNGQ